MALTLLASSAAFAAEPPCPADPAPYAGTDEVVHELRALRSESAQACAALAGRLDTSGAAAHTDAADTAAAVRAIPTPTPSTSSYDGPSSDELEAATAVTHGDAWVLIGLIAAAAVAMPLIRLFTPWLR